MGTDRKNSLFLVGLAVFASIITINQAQTAKDEKVDYLAQQAVRIGEFNNECLRESSLEVEKIDNMQKGIFPNDDPKLKIHLLCYSKKAGLQDADGVFETETLRQRLQAGLRDEQQVAQLIETCVHEDTDPEITAFETLKCLQLTVRPGVIYV